MTQTLATYMRNLGRLSRDAFLAQINCPVLVECTHTDAAPNSAKAFRTEYVESSEVIARVLSPDRREVLLVTKRAEAAFSGHIGVGRTPNLDICIARTGISKFHAYFSAAGDRWQLTDKDSTNGTFVAGERLSPGTSVIVNDGVEIQFATHTFQFLSPQRFFELLRSLAAA